MPEAVGVLGGTFDPVHRGHLRIADEARRRLGLARTLFVPAANPPHKPVCDLSPTDDRVAMLRTALQGVDGVEIRLIELERPGVGYTIDTLRELRDGRPALSPIFILGMDALALIATWRDWTQLLEEFDLAVIDRRDATPCDLPEEVSRRLLTIDPGRSAAAALRPGVGGRIFRLPSAPIAISSSDIRRRVHDGKPIDELVPEGVARYIHEAGLYRIRQEENH